MCKPWRGEARDRSAFGGRASARPEVTHTKSSATFGARPVTDLKGVGPALSQALARLHVSRLIDLLLHLPLRYEDRTRILPMRDLTPGQTCLVQGQVTDSRINQGRQRSWLVTLSDGAGSLRLRFFHFSRNQVNNLSIGRHVRCFGEVRAGFGMLEMVHPEYQDRTEAQTQVETCLTPVYPVARGVNQKRLRGLIAQTLALDWPDDAALPWPELRCLHQPPADIGEENLLRASERLARDELTAYYLVMRFRQSQRQQQKALPLPRSRQLGRELLSRLGFRLTSAQRRVVREVLLDLEASRPMLRLLQGDVGSGKTVIAAFAAIRAAEQGAQTALMAPTEILAEQHYLTFCNWLTPLGVEVVLLKAGQAAPVRRQALSALASGEGLVAVGTHALFQDAAVFRNLALTIVDEQHRFGVHQRMALRAKGVTPHQLIMTATPIPRTLTMALYADMDVSLIDELPPGRPPVDTRLAPARRRDEVVDWIERRLRKGDQAYWVCTLIEESEQVDAEAAEAVCERLQGRLREHAVGLIHGRLSGDDKAQVMAAFQAGDIRLLVATTVVEVGVDVPGATLMVIENPERLGLAQLHQLRGRIGRGSRKSYCLLLYGEEIGAVGRKRLQVIAESRDGFYIAEQDLALRGPGEVMGVRQTGDARFRIADPRQHGHLVPEVIEAGKQLLQTAPDQADALRLLWTGADGGTATV